MNKAVLKRIKEAAARLPIKTEKVRTTEYFTADEVNAAAKEFDPNVKRQVPQGKVYPSTTNGVKEVNHEHKMKAAYKSGGWQAVDEYIAGFSDDE